VIEHSPWFLHQYRRLLKRSGMDPKRIGVDPSVCDEAPLYTRFSQLSFLRYLSPKEKELAILEMAFRLWVDAEANVLRLKFGRPYMLFLSIWEWDEEHLPNPYLFFCGNGIEDLKYKLDLKPADKETSTISTKLSKLGLGAVSSVFEDRVTVPGEVRTIIDFTLRCNIHKILASGR